MEKGYLLAADSGGSKTIWLLLNRKGERIAEFKTDGLGAVKNGLLPVELTVKNAYDSVKNYGQINGIFLSLGGPNTDEVKSALKKYWDNVFITVEREACGNSVLKAAEYLDCKAVVMCGTGSVAVGDTKSGRKFCGGWGPILADGGSGGGLGCDALKLYLRGIDGLENSGGLNKIFKKLMEGLDISIFEDRMELKRRAVNLSRKELAAFNPKIWKAAENGDEICLKLYEKSAREIADMAYMVGENDKEFKILLCGGFFKNGDKFVAMCRKYLALKSEAQLIYERNFSPLTAACIGVLRENGNLITEEIFQNIINERYENYEKRNH